MTKIYFSSGGRSRIPAGSDLSDIPDFDFVTKIEFSSRGLGNGSAGRYLIARPQSYSLDENRLCFRTGSQRRCGSGFVWLNWSAVLSVEVLSSRLYISHSILSGFRNNLMLRSAGTCPCLLREYVRRPIGMIIYFTAHQILYACPFSMPNLPFLWI